MYYLRKEPYEQIIPQIEKTDGTIIPERKYIIEDRAIYKHPQFSRFYRGGFVGIEGTIKALEDYYESTSK